MAAAERLGTVEVTDGADEADEAGAGGWPGGTIVIGMGSFTLRNGGPLTLGHGDAGVRAVPADAPSPGRGWSTTSPSGAFCGSAAGRNTLISPAAATSATPAAASGATCRHAGGIAGGGADPNVGGAMGPFTVGAAGPVTVGAADPVTVGAAGSVVPECAARSAPRRPSQRRITRPVRTVPGCAANLTRG